MPVNLIVTVQIAESHLDAFLTAIEVDCKGSRKEPGCRAFDVLRADDDPLRFYFYESYDDQEALDYHKTTEHFAAWTAFKATGGVESIAVKRTTSLF